MGFQHGTLVLVPIHLGLITADWSIEHKIGVKHSCTLDEVREALQWPARAQAAWEEHEVHGRRLVAVGATGSGRRLVAWLLPTPDWDDDSGEWRVKSARWVDPAR